jgi:hypothetical protein
MYQLAWDPFCERMGHRLPEQMLEQAQKACEFSVPRYIAAVLDLNAGELLPK